MERIRPGTSKPRRTVDRGRLREEDWRQQQRTRHAAREQELADEEDARIEDCQLRARQGRLTEDERRERQNLQAIAGILHAYSRLEAAETAVGAAQRGLLEVVSRAPDTVQLDFRRFYQAGGCSVAHYRQWLAGKCSRKPVKRRRHLRLGANEKMSRRELWLRRCGGDDPQVA